MANDFRRDELADEESGWTSYLGCRPSDCSLHTRSFAEASAYDSLLLLENLQLPHDSPPTFDRQPADADADADADAEDGDSDGDEQAGAGRADSIDESCGSSTLSDADSLRPRAAHFAYRSECRHEFTTTAARKATARLPSDQLEDTATSSTSLDQISTFYGEGEVSKRFHTLEALIPCLREAACQDNEEAMLNAIIDHVQDLEQKVQLLSDVWRLSQINHH